MLHCPEFEWCLDLEFDKVKSVLEGPSGDRPPPFGSSGGLVASSYSSSELDLSVLIEHGSSYTCLLGLSGVEEPS